MLGRIVRSVLACAALCLGTPVHALSLDDGAPPAPAGIAGIAGSYQPPARDEQGYLTPNRNLTAEETSWHLRVALNVAALGCRGPDEARTAAAYNALLNTDSTPLAAAASAIQAQYKARYGADSNARYDDDMTRLYNFFAQPPAHDGFCATAERLLDQLNAVKPKDFPAFAATALPKLEEPFIAVFAAVDQYRASLAKWRDQHPPVVIASASTPVIVPGADSVTDPQPASSEQLTAVDVTRANP